MLEILDFFRLYPASFSGCIFILGLAVGSFLNVVIHRLPIMLKREWRTDCLAFLLQPAQVAEGPLNLFTPRSHCGHCGHTIGALENIPLLSYCYLKGRCKHCRKPISIRYPLIELFTAIISLIVAWRFGPSLQTAAALILSWCLIAASGIDLQHKLLPDTITMPLLWLGILLSFLTVFVDLESSVIGAVAGYLSLWTPFIVFKLITGKEGMGHGDFKLLAALGAWVGWKMLFSIILLSSAVGATIGVLMILCRLQDRKAQIPFGPYLASAGWLTLLWGAQFPVLIF